ncbi:basic amino acid ABC transporter substrate-binding protein [Arthrobacter koreensis]|jgi:polar amino acid transport system substrate-binding protein|uniref:Basic amino acid ABC transporter substrate-binding protein n=1 Tax=Arthrobacter koreensis TaxID=199136 RepID=A0ABY6FS67_9MICC|nr:basic amino acid ABC transporter substrate-binding protein [Arthrobacter koreensis]MDF2498777.1 transporter substrate-binding protein [Arthrobacter koreensis]MEB7446491.1 basic amino acid ABC transporter substrate-binding protein [Arthrobacter koreensis]UYB35579.1 basic amino acid ABC transporter substrate-binding protein [Arthrobacter koreensis]
MPYKARSSVLAAAALSVLALSACGGGSDSASDSGMNLVSEGKLTVCSDIPYPPFEYEENGEYVGFDMDLVKEIASGMGLEASIQDVGFDGLQGGTVLAAGQCDLGASAMTITEERQKNLTFSDPYYDSLQSILVPEGSDITGIEDLAGKKVGVQQGTTGEAYARDNAADAEIISYPSDAELFPALQAGNVDAVLQDLPVNLGHTQEGAFTIAAKFETDESYGFAMAKNASEELVSGVNEQLAALRDNGKYQEIYDKYFTE